MNNRWFYLGLWLKVDASRRQNDPRKVSKVSLIMVRLRGKSCLFRC